MDPQRVKLAEYIEELVEGNEPLDHSSHLLLSGLPADDVEQLSAAWAAVPVPRKLDLLGILADLAEDNVELDFSDVFRMCINDGDAAVRESAVRGLWESEDRTLIRPLIRLLARDPAPEVRAAGALALRRFAENAQEGKLIDRDGQRVRRALMNAIARHGEQTQVTRRAIEAASYFEGSDIDEVIEIALGDDNPLMRQSAIFAMGNSVHLEWLPRLIDALRADEPAIRYEAAGAMGRLGGISLVPHLVPLLKDEDTLVQQAAATALGQLGGQLARQELVKCLETDDEVLEQAARAALAVVDFEEDPLGVRFGG